MYEVTPKSGGRWAISKIIQNVRGNWTTTAIQNKIADVVENYFPPQKADGTYSAPFALVWLGGKLKSADSGTTLLPQLSLTNTLGSLSLQTRENLKLTLADRFRGYFYIDYRDAQVDIPDLVVSGYNENTTFREKPFLSETHNTEFADNFDTNHSARWTGRLNNLVYDSTNLELGDTTASGASNTNIEYTAGSLGSIAHETQGTFLTFSSVSGGWNNACGVRYNNSADQNYHVQHEQGTGTAGTIYWMRNVGGTMTEMSSVSVDVDVSTFRTIRLAAEGAVGANVVLSIWYTDHGASKPSDPGWIGTDASPNQTYTDTAAGRHDDADDTYGGIGLWAPSATFDNRIDFWKGRAISDRVVETTTSTSTTKSTSTSSTTTSSSTSTTKSTSTSSTTSTSTSSTTTSSSTSSTQSTSTSSTTTSSSTSTTQSTSTSSTTTSSSTSTT